MPEDMNKLGAPYIHLAGLRIWVLDREFPDLDDYWDGNWIIVTVQCRAKGAHARVTGPLIHLPEIQRWADDAAQMLQTLVGEANLECMEPELEVKLRMKQLGLISMLVLLMPDNVTHAHRFKFEIDQSSLPGLIKGCHQLLADYPIKSSL